MSVSYQFKKDGESVALSEIDSLLRKDLKLPSNEDRNCTEYMLLTDLGIGILIKHSGSFVTEETFNKTIDDMKPETEDDRYLVELARKYLYKDYVFHAWR